MSDLATIDLTTDAVSRPTAAMLDAMVHAEVGDEQQGTDPTVTALERTVAELLGHEAAVFLPSGSMCNAIAVRVHIRPGGDEIILDRWAHQSESAAGGPAAMSGASLRSLETETGIFTAEQVQKAVRTPSRYAPRSRLLIVEQTTHSGNVWKVEELCGVVEVARKHALRLHLDGARLMNASTAAHVPPASFSGGFDTAFIDFAKGLGCPAGAVLAGSQALIDEAWRYKQMWGGAMRQTGYLAAACLYALNHNVDRLQEDHQHARFFAEAISTVKGVQVDPSSVETNIVIFRVADAEAAVAELQRVGVGLLALDAHHVRAVTYLGITRDALDEAARRMRLVLAG